MLENLKKTTMSCRKVFIRSFYKSGSSRLEACRDDNFLLNNTVKGFTLIELLVVVLIIGILASVALPQYQKAVERSRSTQALTILKSLQQAAEAYYMEHGENVTSFDDLAVGVPPWTGSEKGRSDAIDTRSNGEWSLQLYTTTKGIGQIHMTRLTGDYRGGGFVTEYGSGAEGGINCTERKSSGVMFEGQNGDYCVKIMRGTEVPTPNGTSFRWYQLP